MLKGKDGDKRVQARKRVRKTPVVIPRASAEKVTKMPALKQCAANYSVSPVPIHPAFLGSPPYTRLLEIQNPQPILVRPYICRKKQTANL